MHVVPWYGAPVRGPETTIQLLELGVSLPFVGDYGSYQWLALFIVDTENECYVEASSSRFGVTAVRGGHASRTWPATGSHWELSSTERRNFGYHVVLKPAPIDSRNYAPNELHEADARHADGSVGLCTR
ncbi:hypothetical protein SNOG_03194 [Parastagonospora nodorum SN15]|uniref:Uncharacterized protein n=1 Tax=Phaeosphaeria nodorum (strain SN15 / ATCC MYA-4574 / FGSC 10173) TaxID=321614 RepID=Q0UYH0_PHANO|nr:hypothetical protein SNOG_03194 [Parastagonospora nodorum SN15]EAT89925.1 hypothetical protein SNOG_03194 [Parastagonospora nodorum SN15]